MLLSGTARQPFIEEVVVICVQLIAGHILYRYLILFEVGKHVVYGCDKYHDQDSFIASRRMFDSAGVTYEKMDQIDVEIKRVD